jgi:hypothetical protein
MVSKHNFLLTTLLRNPKQITQMVFNACQSCVSWPSEQTYDDDAAEEIEVDENFYGNHMYDSKLCGAAAEYKMSCGWGCRRQANKEVSSSSSNPNMKHSLGGFEKFCLFFLSFAGESFNV